MRKGIILEINDLYLTLLTPEGEFLRTRKLQHEYQVGEEIHFFPEMAEIKREKFNLSFLNSFRARTISLAAAFMLIMTAFIPVYQGGQVYAYMSIDVNPSLELAVDDELKVLRLKGYNPEGEKLIEEITGWKKKDAADVAEMILDKIEEKGYFEDNKDIVIATVHNGDVKKAADQKLEKKISEIKKATQKENLELKVMEATSEDREKAKKQGLTTGLYKEKQTEKANPASKPENTKPTVKPEAIQQKPVETVKPKQPEKTVAPGQVKKQDQDTTKKKQVQPTNPSNDNKNNSNSKGKKESNNNSNSKVASKGKKQDSSRVNSSGKGNTEKKSNKQQGQKSNNKNRDHKGPQKENGSQSGKDKKEKS